MPDTEKRRNKNGKKSGLAGNHLRAMLSFLVILCVSLPLKSNAGGAGWQAVKAKGGIEVHQKAKKDSPYKVTRGTMLSHAGMFDVLAVLREVEDCQLWLHKCKYGEIISEISKDENLYYTVMDSPFFMKDRDTFVQSVLTYDRDRESLRIEMTGAENTAPPVKKRVRVLDFTGYWQIERHDDEQIRLVYELHMNPQVSAATAVNTTMATSVFETLRNVDRLAQSSPFLNSAVPTSLKTTTRSLAHP